MAKRSNDTVAEAGKSKVRFVYAEVEGSDDSLKSFMATIATAMARPATSHHRALPAERPESVQQDGGNSQVNQADGALPKTDDSETLGIPDSGPNPSSNATASRGRRRGGGQKMDRNSGLSLVPNLDFVPTGKKSLKDFFAERGPRTSEEKILVYISYMAETLELPKITVNHVFSCFQPTGEKYPADLPQTIRNIIKKKAWLAQDGDNLSVTTQGSNYLSHDMGRRSEGGAR